MGRLRGNLQKCLASWVQSTKVCCLLRLWNRDCTPAGEGPEDLQYKWPESREFCRDVWSASLRQLKSNKQYDGGRAHQVGRFLFDWRWKGWLDFWKKMSFFFFLLEVALLLTLACFPQSGRICADQVLEKGNKTTVCFDFQQTPSRKWNIFKCSSFPLLLWT